jgi:hypothetical protein
MILIVEFIKIIGPIIFISILKEFSTLKEFDESIGTKTERTRINFLNLFITVFPQ